LCAAHAVRARRFRGPVCASARRLLLLSRQSHPDAADHAVPAGAPPVDRVGAVTSQSAGSWSLRRGNSDDAHATRSARCGQEHDLALRLLVPQTRCARACGKDQVMSTASEPLSASARIPAAAGAVADAAARPRGVVVMPAYNAARTLRMTYTELPHDSVDKVILVDDGSTDETVEIARELNLKLFLHDRNYGYGANQKTCYAEALNAGANIVVMVHPDYQYDPRLLPDIVRPIERGEADVVLGSRLKSGSALSGGMP